MNTVPTLNIKKDIPMTSSRTTFRRNGTTYVIKNDGSDEDVADIHGIIDDMYYDTMSTARGADIKAAICKFLHIFGSIFIIICSCVTGALGAVSNYNIKNNSTMTSTEDQNIFIVITVLSFSITGAKSLLSMFNIEQRSVVLKEISVGLRKIAREVKNLKTQQLTVEETFKLIDEYHTQIDDLSINMFGTNVNNSSLKVEKVKETKVNITI